MCKQYQINQCVNIHVYDKHNGELNTKVVVFSIYFNIQLCVKRLPVEKVKLHEKLVAFKEVVICNRTFVIHSFTLVGHSKQRVKCVIKNFSTNYELN